MGPRPALSYRRRPASMSEVGPGLRRDDMRVARSLSIARCWNAMLARRYLLLLPLLLSANVAFAQLAQFPTAPLTIITAGGPQKFTVELATTPAQMAQGLMFRRSMAPDAGDRKSTRLNSSHVEISYAVFCLKKKKKK